MTSASNHHWLGALAIGDGWATWRGRSGDGAPHRHIAAQAVFALEGEVAIDDGRGATHAGACVLVEPMATHRLRAGVAVELVFVEPWTAWRRVPALADRWGALSSADVAVVASSERSAFWTLSPDDAKATNDALGDWATRATSYVDSALTDGQVSLSALATHMGLSPDRARHRFADEVGLPLKRYVLWRRLRLAAMRLQEGADATRAAHESGFADSAHLARTLKAMFGVTVTQALAARG